MTAKEILAKVKALFDLPAAPPAAPAAPPAGTATPAPCSYNVDGGQPVFVDISDDGVPDIDMGDKVYTDAALTTPYPDGTYNVTGTQFGFTVAAGSVATVTDVAGTGPGTPVAAVAAPVTAAVPPPLTMEQRVAAIESMLGKIGNAPAPTGMSTDKDIVTLTPEALQGMYAKFGTGTTEERFTNLEIMIKALMECNFGYQIRQGLENEAIQAYKDSVATQVASLVASTAKFEAQQLKISEQDEKIKKQDELIKGIFELAETIVNAPTADPSTLNGNKKEKFNRSQLVEDKYAGPLAVLNELRGAKKTKY